MSKWLNNVGQVCTWQKWEEKDGELVMKNQWKTIEITKEFEGLYKNCMYLQKYSDHLEQLLEKEFIKIEEFNKQMMYDISNASEFSPKKPGNYKFVSHILNLPPQEFKQEDPKPFGKKPAVLEIRQNGNKKPYVLFMQTIQFSPEKDEKGKTRAIFINLENEVDKLNYLMESGKITEEEFNAKVDKLRIDGGEDFWLLYRGYKK